MDSERSAAPARGNNMADDATDRRITKLESVTEVIPAIAAKQHSHANILQAHAGHIAEIIGPKNSLSADVGKLKGAIGLIEHRLTNIDSTMLEVKVSVASLVKSTELARVERGLARTDTEGQWKLKAAVATSLVTATAAIFIASMQFM